jgi:hypothetical protein
MRYAVRTPVTHRTGHGGQVARGHRLAVEMDDSRYAAHAGDNTYSAGRGRYVTSFNALRCSTGSGSATSPLGIVGTALPRAVLQTGTQGTSDFVELDESTVDQLAEQRLKVDAECGRVDLVL